MIAVLGARARVEAAELGRREGGGIGERGGHCGGSGDGDGDGMTKAQKQH